MKDSRQELDYLRKHANRRQLCQKRETMKKFLGLFIGNSLRLINEEICGDALDVLYGLQTGISCWNV